MKNSRERYITERRYAKIIEDNGGYDRGDGEMNPAIFSYFLGDVLLRSLESSDIWEPFAGHTKKSTNMDLCEKLGVNLIAYDLDPIDDRVKRKDSTVCGPGVPIGGVLFHPPYFGASAMSNEDGEVSLRIDRDSYCHAIAKTIVLSMESLVSGGLACVVCRDYRHKGMQITLSEWMCSLFIDRFGFELVEVWSSQPDVILILERL